MRGSHRLIGACSIAVCLLVAGCGSDDDAAKRDQAYIESVNVAMKRFERAAAQLPSGFEAATLRTYSAALDNAAGSLERIDPPATVAGLHAQLTTDVAGYADEIDAAAQAPLSSDPDRVVAAQQQLLKATAAANRSVNRTLTEIGRRLDAEA